MSSESLDRERRIQDLQIQSDLAESRLQRLHKLLPSRFKESTGVYNLTFSLNDSLFLG